MSSAILATGLYPRSHDAQVLRPHGTPARASGRPAAPGDDYGAHGRSPTGATIDWPAHLHQVGDRRQRRSTTSTSARATREPIVFIHGLGGQWQNWLENIPRAAQERRVIALDLPGFGLSPMPRERDHDPGYGRTVDALCDAARPRPRRRRRQLDGRLHRAPRWRSSSRSGWTGCCSCRPPGSPAADLAHAPILTLGRVATAIATLQRGPATASWRRRPQGAAPVARARGPPPVAAQADLAYEGFFKGTGKPGFERRAARLPRLRLPRPAAGDRRARR